VAISISAVGSDHATPSTADGVPVAGVQPSTVDRHRRQQQSSVDRTSTVEDLELVLDPQQPVRPALCP
jgi:hypothetical protein